MSKKLYAVGIGKKVEGNFEYFKVFIIESEVIISRNDYHSILSSNLTTKDYEYISLNDISIENSMLCIMSLDNEPKSEEESLLIQKLIFKGILEKLYLQYRDLIRVQYYWIQGQYGY